MLLATLITSHNRKIKTLECVQSLSEQILPDNIIIDIFLTDDGSTDGTASSIIEFYPQVTIVNGDGTLFWNRGMYVAWVEASKHKDYDYYLWLNDDTVLNNDAIQQLLVSSKQKRDCSIIVGTTSNKWDNSKFTYGGRKKDSSLISPSDRILQCEHFNGNIVLIPRLVYSLVGKNDPVFHHALGDFDYGLRAKKFGIDSYVAPGILGECNEHDRLPMWCDPGVSFSKRWKAFRKPLGHNPEEYFIFEKRHKGLIMAIFHYFTNHLRVIMPSLWIKTT